LSFSRRQRAWPTDHQWVAVQDLRLRVGPATR
jgi:hypothetical protein